jgi:LPPG:FO 2-phospho-L-lactate transferase
VSHVLALCGGVGGAKLVFGLTKILNERDLTVIVNCGDDFEHLGLYVAPDIDSVVYALSGLSDRVRGWGRRDETWNFMAALSALGGESWFQLGDADLAMHVERTRRLAAGQSLSEVTAALAEALGIRHTIAPMSDQPVRTMIDTDRGELGFQQYFVRARCEPVARAIRWQGAEVAVPSAALSAALKRSDLAGVIICPSNPYLSIDPILAVPGVRDALAALEAPVVAVSPIVGGEALKGPAAKLMRELGATVGVAAVAAHYDGFLDGLVFDRADAAHAGDLATLGVAALVTDTVMRTDQDRTRLADETLSFALRACEPTPAP